MTMNKLTARESILRALQEGDRLTPYDAWLEHGTSRLSAVIHTLRGEGYAICSKRISVKTRKGKIAHIAEYSLLPGGDMADTSRKGC